jgi:hypothetical protein
MGASVNTYDWQAKGYPNPGSDKAKFIGCKCAVMDNERGRGILTVGKDGKLEPAWWITQGCPLHAPEGEE